MKLAVLFPGVGYTCEKPLIYYAGKCAAAQGYQVLPVAYGDLPRDVRGDPQKRQLCLDIACAQTEQALESVRWQEYEDILFIGKSIGTTVAARYAQAHNVAARLILLTPLTDTFQYTSGSRAIVFHGTADPWADTSQIRRMCREQNLLLHLTEGANHSLETGDLRVDLATLAQTVELMAQFIRN